MKKQLLILWALLFSIMSFAQTTLVNYPFTNNPVGNGLNYDVLDPSYDGVTIPVPTLTYHANGGAAKTPTYENNMLRTSAGGDHLELTINTTGRSGLVLSFNGDFQALGLTGRWNVAVNSGSGYVPRGQLSLFSILGIRIGGNTSLNISDLDPLSDNNPNLKIKITADSDAWLDLWNIRIDNLKLTSGSPKIRVYTGNNTDADTDGNIGENVDIPHLSPASRAFDTDFGTLQTTGTARVRTFRVRNYLGEKGSSLDVSNIAVTGANPGDFTVSPTSLLDIGRSTASNGTYKEFTISFLPLGDGVRTAEVYLYSNAAPSPYIFTIIGVGASCSLIAGTYAQNTMAIGQQTLEGNYLSNDLIGGVANPGSDNTINTRLYPDGNLYTSSVTSWYVRNATKTVEFDELNISNQKNVSIVFNIAAFTTTNKTRPWYDTWSDTTSWWENGLNSASYVTLSVQKTDNTWVDMTLRGSPNTNKYYQTNFSSGSQYLNSSFTNSSINNTGTKYTSFKFDIPSSSGIQNLKFKIKGYTDSNDRLWLIDDVKVLTSNSVYKTFTVGNVWSPSPPEVNEKAVIEGTYTNSGNPTICECEVKPGGSVTIPASTSLTVRGNIINNGTFTLKSDANLLQIEKDAVNTGNIIVERSVANMDNIPSKMDYVYWSSPVANQNLQTFSPGTPATNIMQYKESTDYFVTTYDGVFKPAKGYAIRAETSGVSSPSYGKDYLFTGVPNNGDYSLPVTRSPNSGAVIHGYNLIGNPYPSNINFDELYKGNCSGGDCLIWNTAYFWTNNVFEPTQMGQGYAGNNYAIYNGTGGVGATSTSAGGTGNTIKPNGIVKVGQGIIIQAKTSGSLNFKNSYGTGKDLRVATAGTFYQKNGEGKNRFWLKLISPDEIVNTQLIGYVDGATDDFDQDYDAEAFGLSSNLFYSVLNGKRLLIQGKSAQFNQDDHIILGANFFKNQEYTIAIEQPEGIFEVAQNVYLKDKQTGVITNLSQNSYTFTANAGENTGRFEIIYKPETILVTDSAAKDQILVYRDQDNFVIQSPKTIASVEVYEMSGKLFKVLKPNNKKAVLEGAALARGIYILHIKATDGEVSNKKIIR